MQALSIHKVDAYRSELPDMPIDAAWILEGQPRARGAVLLQTADKLVSSGLWTCSAGRFRWEFSWDEFIQRLGRRGQHSLRAFSEGAENAVASAALCSQVLHAAHAGA